jgi:hypothetical protein
MSKIICHPGRKKRQSRRTIHVATLNRDQGRSEPDGPAGAVAKMTYGCYIPPEDGAWNEAMQFPQQTIQQIVDSEREMVLTASQRFGRYYDAVPECVVFATRFLKSIDPDRWVFAGFQAGEKHLTLALFSTVRLHKEQAMMDLRQALEAGACAAFAIANPDHGHFVDTDKFGVLDPSQKLASKRYKWLDAKYPNASKAIQERKDQINSSNLHANLLSAYGRSRANEQEGWFSEPLFDVENEYHVKTDLWRIADSAPADIAPLQRLSRKGQPKFYCSAGGPPVFYELHAKLPELSL